jgi:hypothetical protein
MMHKLHAKKRTLRKAICISARCLASSQGFWSVKNYLLVRKANRICLPISSPRRLKCVEVLVYCNCLTAAEKELFIRNKTLAYMERRELGQLSSYRDQVTGRTTEDLWPDSWERQDICCPKYSDGIRIPPNNLCLYWLAVGRILPIASQHKRMTYTNCCIYRVVPPDDEQ